MRLMTPRTAAFLTILLVPTPSGTTGEGEGPWARIAGYRQGQPRDALAAIEAELRLASPDRLGSFEDGLLALLRSPEASADAKEWACRQLRIAGSERSVAPLAALLADESLGTVARWALQGIPGATVDAALRDALPKLVGAPRVGAVLTLGARGDERSVASLAPFVSNPDPALAEAALYALGRIGGKEAAAAILAAAPGPAPGYRRHALLLCAERMAADGGAVEAAEIYGRLWRDDGDLAVRAAALRGLLACRAPDAGAAVASALRAEDARLRAAAARALCDAGDPELRKNVLADIASLPADGAVRVLGLLEDDAALPLAKEAAKAGDEAVRCAAIEAIGRLGDASAVSMLLEEAARPDGPVPAAARESLRRLAGSNVDVALVAALRAGPAAGAGVRVEAMRALAARGAAAASAALLDSVRDADARVRAAALDALAAVADAGTLPALVVLVAEPGSPEVKAGAARAVSEACRRIRDRDATAAAIVAAMSGRDASVRAEILRLLPAAASPPALAALREAAKDPEPSVREAAARVLGDWPDPAALDDLIEMAKTADAADRRSAALRGVARLAALPGAPSDRAPGILVEAMKLATSPEDKKSVISALAAIPGRSALDAALGFVVDPELEVDAATAVVRIAKALRKTDAETADLALQKLLELCRSPVARQVAESSLFVPRGLVNIAQQATATSPDGIEKDGASNGDQAAIDGDPGTYWDEEDGKALYRLTVTLKQTRRIAALSILGWEHHNYAPKDFKVLLDGVVVKTIEDAAYDDNFLVIPLEEVGCSKIELEITGYYGSSPAIRELGIYRRVAER